MPIKINPLSGEFDFTDNQGFSGITGPGSSTDNAIVRWDGTTGLVVQNSGVTISDTNVVSGATQINVDNLRLDGNTISSTDTNGDINLTPDGTGTIVSDARGYDVNPGSDTDADLITVGVTGSPTFSWNETDDTFNITNGLIVEDNFIAGNPGVENGGITVHGATYDSVAKVSDIGGSNVAQFILHRHSTTLAPLIVSARSNSNTSSHGIVTDGQSLLQLYGVGWDGSDYEIGAEISFEVDGTPGSDDMPGRIVFLTTPDGAFTPVEAMRINQDQTITFANPLEVSNGGTGATTLTDGGIILGSGTSAVTVTSQPTNGQLLIGSTGGDPVLGTLTQPAAGITITEGAGTITFALADDLANVEAMSGTGVAIRNGNSSWLTRQIAAGTGIDVTNGNGVSGDPTIAFDVTEVASIATSFAGDSGSATPASNVLTVAGGTGITTSAASDTVTINLDSPVDETNGGTGQTTFTTGDILYASASNTLSKLAVGSDGEVLTLASGVPTWAAATGGGLTWNTVTGTSQALSVDNGYIGNNGTGISYSLPASAAVGDRIKILNIGAGLPTITQGAGQSILFVDTATTTGTGGSLAGALQYCSLELICVTANTTFHAVPLTGTWTVT